MVQLLSSFQCRSSRKYYYYRRPIGDPSEIDIPKRKPIGDFDMLHRRPTCPIGDRHAPWEKTFTIGDLHGCGVPSETNMHAESNRNLNTYLFKYTHFYLLFAYLHILE